MSCIKFCIACIKNEAIKLEKNTLEPEIIINRSFQPSFFKWTNCPRIQTGELLLLCLF